MLWNHEVDRALVSQVPEDEIRQIKNEFITDRIRNSIRVWGNRPELLLNIILTATKALALLTSKVLTAARELKNKLFHEAMEKEYGTKTVIKAEDAAYQKECAKWEEVYGEKATPKAETMHEKIQRYKEKVDRQNTNQPYQHRDKGAR